MAMGSLSPWRESRRTPEKEIDLQSDTYPGPFVSDKVYPNSPTLESAPETRGARLAQPEIRDRCRKPRAFDGEGAGRSARPFFVFAGRSEKSVSRRRTDNQDLSA